MGKRKRKEKDEEEIRRKIRRLERRLKHRKESNCTDSEEYYDESDHSFSSNQGIRSIVSIPLNVNNSIIANDQSRDKSEESILSPEILDALGESKNKLETFAPKIRDEISERWGKILVEGLNKEAIQKLMEKIQVPENFKLLKAPELNTEVSTVLSESTKNRDKRLEKAQNYLGISIAGITNLMSALIDGDMEKTDIIKKISEIGQLLLDLHCQNTYARRKLISFSLDKKFTTMIQGVKRDTLLFGENLGEKIKANKSAETSGFQIGRPFEPQSSTSSRPSQPPVRPGNLRGPPRSQAQRGRRGGPRNQISSQTLRRPPVTTDRYNSAAKNFNSRTVQRN